MDREYANFRYEDQDPVLPPGMENYCQINFGYLVIQFGRITWLNIPFPTQETRLRVQFWGDVKPGRMLVATNCSESLKQLYQNKITYQIRCSIWHFCKYLLDMKDMNINLVDKTGRILGFVNVKLEYLIKQFVHENDESPFYKDLNGLFPIIQGAHKIGEVELQMLCRFDLKFN